MEQTETKQLSVAVNQDGHVLDNHYAKAYQQFGHSLIKTPLDDQLNTKIAAILPENYIGVDLGASNSSVADQIVRRANKLGKTGSFISVDPLPTDQRTLKFTAEEYMSQAQPEKFDVILVKHALHLVQDIKQFLLMCRKCLKKNGVFVTLLLSKDTTLPWTQPLQNRFETSCLDFVPAVDLSEFSIQSEEEWSLRKIQKTSFIGMIKNRGWSNLFSNTEEQINQCVQKLQKTQQKDIPNGKVRLVLHYVRKIEK